MGFVSKKHRLGSSTAAATLVTTTGLTGLAVAAALLPAATAAQAQVPFHVLRPATGSRVRELVRIQFSRPALGSAQYLQLIIDGRFRSAVAIPAASKTAVYTDEVEASKDRVALLWNTKAIDNGPNVPDDQRVVQDGPHTIQVVALDSAGRRLGQDTITVNVDNRLTTPANGIAMDYRFSLGSTSYYAEKSEVDFIAAQNQNAPGGGGVGGSPYSGGYGQRAYYGGPRQQADYGDMGGPGGYAPGQVQVNPNVPIQTVRAKFERSVEDYLGGNTYFIRDKVIGGVIQGQNGTAALLGDVYDFKSRYRTVSITGAVLDSGKASRPGAYVALLTPNLGGGLRRVGQSWKSRTPIKLEWATLDAPPVVYADNTLEGLEWQDGYQTARIRQKFDGNVDMPIYGGAGVIKNAKVSMDRTIWFGYKAGKIVRMETKVTVEGDAPQSVITAMVPGGVGGGAGAPGAGPGGYPGGYPGAPGGYPGGMMGMRGGGAGMMFPGGGGGFPGAEGSFEAPGGAGGFPGQPGQGGFGALAQQQPQEEPRVPAKFESTSTVTLDHSTSGAAARIARR